MRRLERTSDTSMHAEPDGDDTTPSDLARFVEAFAAVWARPSIAGFDRLIHADVKFVAPMMNVTVGREACLEELRRLLALRPDMHLEVEHWSGSGDVVFIELALIATIAGREIRIPAVDRIRLKNGRVIERVSYGDPLPALWALMRHPSEWLHWWKSGLGPPKRRRRLAYDGP